MGCRPRSPAWSPRRLTHARASPRLWPRTGCDVGVFAAVPPSSLWTRGLRLTGALAGADTAPDRARECGSRGHCRPGSAARRGGADARGRRRPWPDSSTGPMIAVFQPWSGQPIVTGCRGLDPPCSVHHRSPRSVRTPFADPRPATATRAARGTPRRRGSASARRPGSPRSATRRASGPSTRRSRHVVILRHDGPPPVFLLLVRVCDSPGIAPPRQASWMRAGTPGAWTFSGIAPTMGNSDHSFGVMMWPHGSRTVAGTEGPYAMVALGYRRALVEVLWPFTAEGMGRPRPRVRCRC
jgi:hypothetical protein